MKNCRKAFEGVIKYLRHIVEDFCKKWSGGRPEDLCIGYEIF